MSQFNAPIRKAGGGLDVFTGLLFAAFVVLTTGCILLAMNNMKHSGDAEGNSGGLFQLAE